VLCQKESFGDDVEIFGSSKSDKNSIIFQSIQSSIYTGKEAVKPLTDVATCWWWLRYTMCFRIQYLKQESGSMFGGGDLPEDLEIPNDDWNDLASVIKVLEPFRSAQLFLEREKYVSSSSFVIPTVFLCCNDSLREEGQANSTVPESIRALSRTGYEI